MSCAFLHLGQVIIRPSTSFRRGLVVIVLSTGNRVQVNNSINSVTKYPIHPIMTSKTSTKPLCKCHKKPMRWGSNKNLKGGGRWRCRVKQRSYESKYDVKRSQKLQRKLYVYKHKLGLRIEAKRAMIVQLEAELQRLKEVSA
jgi:hypothetical protein